MITDPKNDDAGAETGRDEALWELLGKARPVRVSPYFVRRVLRDLDAGDAVADNDLAAGWRAWLRPAWLLAAGTAALAVVIGVVSLPSFPSLPMNGRPVAVATRVHLPRQVATVPAVLPAPAAPAASTSGGAPDVELASDVSPQDVDVIADLDNLVAREETSVWTDDTSRF
jgi:hypothetical protein